MGDFQTPELSLLNKATISYAYLHTNSTTHESLLGAIAELVDNSRDAGSKTLKIDFDQSAEFLSFLDDGCGMTHSEAVSVISFGFSNKRSQAGMIGQYGNGLKSGAMRIAKDMMVLTKKSGQLSCLLLCRTFHDKFKCQEVFVPAPSFNEVDRHMCAETDEEIKKHGLEMTMIYEYSPFKTQEELFGQFDKITGESGTLVILYNLRRLMDGRFELDFDTDPEDIRQNDAILQREDEYNSLRSYLAVLYMAPKMKMYLRGKKVNTVRIISQLHSKYKYLYVAKTLKACATREYERCKTMLKEAEDGLKQAQSEVGAFNAKNTGKNVLDKNLRLQTRLLQSSVADAIERVNMMKKQVEEAKKAIKDPAPLELLFGLNLHHRNRYGCMFYNNGRLILGYQKTACQKDYNDIYLKCLGVIGVVDVPYSVLAPTHNKQSFENQREFMSLMKAMSDHMDHYWTKMFPDKSPTRIKMHWAKYGYVNTDWTAGPTPDAEGKKCRYERLGHTIQCDSCLKWRHVGFQLQIMHYGVPDTWTCQDMPNSLQRDCNIVEEPDKPFIKNIGILTADMMDKPDKADKMEKVNGFSNQREINIKPLVKKVLEDRRPVVEPLKRAVSTQKQVLTLESDNEEEERAKIDKEDEASKMKKKRPEATKIKKRIVDESDGSDYEEKPKRRKELEKTATIPERRVAKKQQDVKPILSSRMTGTAPTMARRGPVKKTIIDDDEDDDEEEDDKEIIRKVPPRKPISQVPSTSKTAETKKTVTAVTTNARGRPPTKVNGGTEPLNPNERIELMRLRSEHNKVKEQLSQISKRDSFVMEMLRQMAKKGCVEADKLLRKPVDQIVETNVEKMYTSFWNEKVQTPLRLAEEKILENRGRPSTSAEEQPIDQNLKYEFVRIIDWILSTQEDVLDLPRNGLSLETLPLYAHKMSNHLQQFDDQDD